MQVKISDIYMCELNVILFTNLFQIVLLKNTKAKWTLYNIKMKRKHTKTRRKHRDTPGLETWPHIFKLIKNTLTSAYSYNFSSH